MHADDVMLTWVSDFSHPHRVPGAQTLPKTRAQGAPVGAPPGGMMVKRQWMIRKTSDVEMEERMSKFWLKKIRKQALIEKQTAANKIQTS